MNLFRSEEHVKRWPLYYRMVEDFILPVSDWASVFSGPLFTQRLEPNYLAHAEQYVEQYHQALKDVGKTSPFWQYPLIEGMEVVKLSRYRVVGRYTRYDDEVLNKLKDARQNITEALGSESSKRKNYLIWAAPGSGKTYFVEQIAKVAGERCHYIELNLAKLDESEFQLGLDEAASSHLPVLCLVDEVDAKPDADWPYERLLPMLDLSSRGDVRPVFILAGSSGFSLEGMKENISSRSKGADLLSRVPSENEILIPPMSFGDRILVVLSQFLDVAEQSGHDIQAVEKLGLYYIALHPSLNNARQLREFAIRAIERVPRGDDRIKYDHLFTPGDPENKRFWMEVSAVADALINHYIHVEA